MVKFKKQTNKNRNKKKQKRSKNCFRFRNASQNGVISLIKNCLKKPRYLSTKFQILCIKISNHTIFTSMWYKCCLFVCLFVFVLFCFVLFFFVCSFVRSFVFKKCMERLKTFNVNSRNYNDKELDGRV